MNAIKRTFGFINNHPLAKKHLVTAYLRFLSWQIKSRFTKGLKPYLFLHGVYFYAKKGLTGISGNIYTGLHEFNDMGFLLHFLRSTDTFFDIGANVGSYTLLASGVIKSKSVAFEPIPSTYNILKKNIALNGLNKLVILENKGVGNKNENLTFTALEDTTNHIILDPLIEQNTISVPITTLDNYTSQKPSLIKIDVEGFETEVLNGAEQILNGSTLKAIIIELNGSGGRYGYDENEIHKKLTSYEFRPFAYNPFNRVLERLDTFGSHNTIYIRDWDFVIQRLASAPAFKIFNSAT